MWGEFLQQFPRVIGKGRQNILIPPGWPLYLSPFHNLSVEDATELALDRPLWSLLSASRVTLPGFLKTRQPTKHSGVMSIWLSAISLTKAGSVAQAVPTTDGLTSYAGTTTTRHQLTCGEDPPYVVIWEWCYGPRRLRVDDDDDESYTLNWCQPNSDDNKYWLH